MASFTKKYAQALFQSLGSEKCNELIVQKEDLKACFANPDFLCVIRSPFVSCEEKISLILKVFQNQDSATQRALSVIGRANRLEFILQILDELECLLNVNSHQCRAVVFYRKELNPVLLQNLKSELEKKIGYQLQMQEALWDKEGIKCYIDELDLEISFSQEQLMRDLQSYILDSLMKGVQIEN